MQEDLWQTLDLDTLFDQDTADDYYFLDDYVLNKKLDFHYMAD